ncbi:MAG: nucleotidyltransferase family protein [Candidatus Omnitrophota bacterium]
MSIGKKVTQAVILTGGEGRRLRPITETIPKSMIPIKGKPFLRYQLDLIKTFGINEVLILVGYLGEEIIKYFKDGKKFGLQIDYSFEKQLLGTAGALKNAEKKLNNYFLLLNGDHSCPN